MRQYERNAQVASTVVAAAGTYHIGRNNAQAEAWWAAREGMDPQQASHRAAAAVGFRALWGMFWIWWCLPMYALGWMAIAGGIHIIAVSNGVPIEDLQAGTLEDATGFHGLAFLVAGLALVIIFGYGGLLIPAHIWRWQTAGVPGYNDNKRWWKLYRRPTPREIHQMDQSPDARFGMSGPFAKVMAVFFVYFPLILWPAFWMGSWVVVAGYRLLSGTGVA